MAARSPYVGGTRAALTYCVRREHLRRTTRIAFVVGVLLTSVNQGAVILGGDASTLTWVRSAVNFLIPFVVSNLGLLSGRGARSGPAPAVGSVDDEH
ncbi:MAG: nitrate/nitrite transporter NrtS [Solirubrobacteraceae bacterium]